jgi:hypothetical protein
VASVICILGDPLTCPLVHVNKAVNATQAATKQRLSDRNKPGETHHVALAHSSRRGYQSDLSR